MSVHRRQFSLDLRAHRGCAYTGKIKITKYFLSYPLMEQEAQQRKICLPQEPRKRKRGPFCFGSCTPILAALPLSCPYLSYICHASCISRITQLCNAPATIGSPSPRPKGQPSKRDRIFAPLHESMSGKASKCKFGDSNAITTDSESSTSKSRSESMVCISYGLSRPPYG